MHVQSNNNIPHFFCLEIMARLAQLPQHTRLHPCVLGPHFRFVYDAQLKPKFTLRAMISESSLCQCVSLLSGGNKGWCIKINEENNKKKKEDYVEFITCPFLMLNSYAL